LRTLLPGAAQSDVRNLGFGTPGETTRMRLITIGFGHNRSGGPA
jgi:hypothetical protein